MPRGFGPNWRSRALQFPVRTLGLRHSSPTITSVERAVVGPTSQCSLGFACTTQQGAFVTDPLVLGKAGDCTMISVIIRPNSHPSSISWPCPVGNGYGSFCVCPKLLPRSAQASLFVLVRPSPRSASAHLGRDARCPHDATLSAQELRLPLLPGTFWSLTPAQSHLEVNCVGV